MSTVFLKLLNMSITASWLILAVLAARILLKKAPRWIVCLLWALVALRLLCPYSLKSVLSLVPSAETIPADIALSSQPEIHSGISVINSAVNPIINNMANPDIAESVVPGTAAAVNPLQTIIPFISYIWAVGVAGMLVYALASYLRLRKTVAASASIKDRVLACDEIKTPFILGVIRPKIYIPSAMCGETLDCVLLHETAHLKRRDHWWKPFGFLLLAVYWFNPLCWIAYILLCRDIEAACDEKVVRDMDRDGVATYSQALLDCSFPRKRIAACPLAFGEVGVKQRIKGVLNYRRPAFWIILIAVVICIAIVVCFMTDPISSESVPQNSIEKINEAVSSIKQDECANLQLTIYYLPPQILTRKPLTVDELMSFPQVQVINVFGDELDETLQTLKAEIATINLVSANETTNQNARLYYIFEMDGEKVFDACFIGENHSFFIDGIAVKFNDFFLEIIKAYIPEEVYSSIAINEMN